MSIKEKFEDTKFKGVIRICISKLVSMSSAFLVNYVIGRR